MIRGRAPACAALLLAACALSGCVAAVIPLAAAGTMVKRAADGSLDGTLDGSRRRAAAAAAATPPPATDGLPAIDGMGTARLTTLTELPPPSPAPSAGQRDAVVNFSVYALQQAKREPGTSPREGALLASPGSLSAVRQDCGTRPPAVLIDLDPGRASFDPLGDLAPPAALGPALLSLRAQGVLVVWQSRLGDNFAETVREALATSGLDPAGVDALLLASSLEQRKQSLRDDYAASHCIVAMLGDERADFDELFLYLKEPDAAVGLESLIGAGWFLADDLFIPLPDDAS